MMEIEKDMDVEDSHILARQKSKQREKKQNNDCKIFLKGTQGYFKMHCCMM